MNEERRTRSGALAAFFADLLDIPALLSAATMEGHGSYEWVAGDERPGGTFPAPEAPQRSVEKLASMPATRTV